MCILKDLKALLSFKTFFPLFIFVFDTFLFVFLVVFDRRSEAIHAPVVFLLHSFVPNEKGFPISITYLVIGTRNLSQLFIETKLKTST